MAAALRPHVGCGCRAALRIAPLLGLSLPPIPPPTSAWRARALLGRHRRRAAQCWRFRVGCHRRLLTAFLVTEFSLADVGGYKTLCILTSFRLAQKYRSPLKKSLTACFLPPALRAAPAHSPHGGHTDLTPSPVDGLTRITLPRKQMGASFFDATPSASTMSTSEAYRWARSVYRDDTAATVPHGGSYGDHARPWSPVGAGIWSPLLR